MNALRVFLFLIVVVVTVSDAVRIRRKRGSTDPQIPSDVTWSSWGEWQGQCGQTCDGGVKTRVRSGAAGYRKLEQKTTEKCPCAAVPQQQTYATAAWSAWSDWSSCTTCGASQTRSRTCSATNGNSQCPGEATQSQTCPSSGSYCSTWSEWSAWGTCSVTCGSGNLDRSRTCSGSSCVGSATESKACNSAACCSWTDWSAWGSCSATCDSGTMTRSRTCGSGQPGATGGKNYVTTAGQCSATQCGSSADATGSQACPSLPSCATWGAWQPPSACSTTCGEGKASKTRVCSVEGQCPGSGSEPNSCNTGPCPSYSAWGEWSACSSTCGSGQKSRNRFCSHGTLCDGSAADTQSCDSGPCASWGEWATGYQACSVSCGKGEKVSRRKCSVAGKCVGEEKRAESCSAAPCPTWAEWSQWTTCGYGCGTPASTQTRSRTCPTQNACGNGEASQSQSCPAQPPCQTQPPTQPSYVPTTQGYFKPIYQNFYANRNG